MAKKAEVQETEVKEPVKPKKIESKYPMAELAANSRKLFKVSPECVITALSLEHVKEATVEEAGKIVDKFMKQEVR